MNRKSGGLLCTYIRLTHRRREPRSFLQIFKDPSHALAQVLLYHYYKISIMKNRTVTYFSKHKALKIMESPLTADLKTLLSATFAISHSRVVKKHIQNTLQELSMPSYKLTA